MDFLLPASWASAFRRVERDFDMLPVVESVRQHLEIPVLAVSVYLVMVFYVPGRLAKPLTLKWQFTLWNLLLSLFSIVGVSRVAPVLLHNLDTHGLRYTYCEPSLSWYGKGPVGLWVTLFVFSKIPELVDTFFLVFQKKPVIFLHWFHHVTVLLYCWHAYHLAVAPGLWFATMNYSVHSIMYFYYFLMSIGAKSLARPLAPYITTLQLLQMVAGAAITLLSAWDYTFPTPGTTPCHVDPANFKLGLAMYLSYFVLFAVLFYNHYIKPNGKHVRAPRSKAQGQASEPSLVAECTSGDAAGMFHGPQRSSSSSEEEEEEQQQPQEKRKPLRHARAGQPRAT